MQDKMCEYFVFNLFSVFSKFIFTFSNFENPKLDTLNSKRRTTNTYKKNKENFQLTHRNMFYPHGELKVDCNKFINEEVS